MSRHHPPASLWQVRVQIEPGFEEPVEALLTETLSVPVTTWTDALKGSQTVSAYLSSLPLKPTELQQMLVRSLNHLHRHHDKPPTTRVSIKRLPAEDWEHSWKKHFPALEVGNRVLLRPSWSRRKPKPGAVEVLLDPGLSFGTGHHPTTLFCLEEIVRHSNDARCGAFLDLGCGSGILTITAAKLGYRPVRALEFDPVAVRIARENALRNDVASIANIEKRDVASLPLRPRLRYDLVCANLMAGLLREHHQRIAAQLAPHGRLVLAGILATEFDEVKAVYLSAGLRMSRSKSLKGWRSTCFRRA